METLRVRRIDVGGKMTEDDFIVFNQRLKRYGYDKAIDLLRDFKDGKFPESQIPTITAPLGNSNGSGQVTVTTEGANNVIEFCKNLDGAKLKRYYLETLKLSSEYAGDCVSYFEKFYKIFFTNPEQIKTLTPYKRGWVLCAMRNFGKYSYYLTGNKDVKTEVAEVIERFGLNEGIDRKHKVFLVDDNFVQSKVKIITDMQGDLGFFARFGLFTGNREDELIYMKGKEICDKTATCGCQKLHVLNKGKVSVVVLNWFRGQKKAYFSLVPSAVWAEFRALPAFTQTEIETTHHYLKAKFGLKYMELRKLHYNVMVRTLDQPQAEVLAGRANAVSARHYALYEMDKMAELYAQAWERFGLKID